MKLVMKGVRLALLFLAGVALTPPAVATDLQMRATATGDGVEITFKGVDSDKGVPDGALHCVTGTRQNWAGINGYQRFDLSRMIGGCVALTSRTVDITHTVNGTGRMCLVPVFVDRSGGFISWSHHPDGATQLKTRKGNMVTAIIVGPGSVRPATAEEALGCD